MRLGEKHRKAIELLIAGDLTKEQIADSVNVSRKTLYNWLENEDFAAEYTAQLDEMDRKIRRRIAGMATKALDRQEKILDKSKNDMAAATVAADVLDRAGYKPDDKIAVEAAAPVQIIYDIPTGGDDDAASV